MTEGQKDAESTPPSTPLGYNNILGGIEQKSSGGNDGVS